MSPLPKSLAAGRAARHSEAMDPKPDNPRLAIAFMVLATVFIAATMLLAKALGTDRLGDPLHPIQVSHGRFLFALIGLVLAATIVRPTFSRPHIRFHLLRSVAGWLGVTMMFASVIFIPLPDATAISFLNPVFAMILAIPLLGERVGPIRWLAAAIALVGALVLLRPGPGTFQITALLALGAAVMFGLEIVVMKRLAKREGLFQILLINNALGLTFSTIAVSFVFLSPTLAQWIALAALGGLMALAQTCYVNSVSRADASLVVPFSYGTLVFATFYDWVIFAEIPDRISVLGACIIIAGAAMLAWREATRKATAT